MREIQASQITETVARLAVEANHFLGDDVVAALKNAREIEESPQGKEVLNQLLANVEIAKKGEFPLCQDTGVAVIVVELGQDAHIVGGALNEAIHAGVRKGYTDGFLRKSMVGQPFSARKNSKDNTPAMIHTDIVPGDKLHITIMPKGGGCENMSALGMLKPADGRQGVIDFVVNTIDKAGSNPCPPTIVGIGIGGSADQAMWLAKKSLLRPVGQPNPDEETAALEKELLEKINNLGIGPMGLGGRITSLAAHVLVSPCHIASMPVGVNVQCHSARYKEALL
ncbi:fumarate hydratase subunit alpha [Anaerolineae bacterium]|nr:fumarate hydratase subunit alpha [Anaerolineae bacterium]